MPRFRPVAIFLAQPGQQPRLSGSLICALQLSREWIVPLIWRDVRSITSITQDGLTIAPSGYSLSADKVYITASLTSEPLVVVYTYGTATTPSRIKQAVMIYCSVLGNQSGDSDLHNQQVSSERTGDHTITYRDSDKNAATTRANAILNDYRLYG